MKILSKICLLLFLFVSLFIFNSDLLFANRIGGTDFGGMFVNWFESVLVGVIVLSSIVAVAVLILNAFVYITASGDEAKVQKATRGITYAIVGLVVAAIAFLIVNFVIGTIEETSFVLQVLV